MPPPGSIPPMSLAKKGWDRAKRSGKRGKEPDDDHYKARVDARFFLRGI